MSLSSTVAFKKLKPTIAEVIELSVPSVKDLQKKGPGDLEIICDTFKKELITKIPEEYHSTAAFIVLIEELPEFIKNASDARAQQLTINLLLKDGVIVFKLYDDGKGVEKKAETLYQHLSSSDIVNVDELLSNPSRLSMESYKSEELGEYTGGCGMALIRAHRYLVNYGGKICFCKTAASGESKMGDAIPITVEISSNLKPILQTYEDFKKSYLGISSPIVSMRDLNEDPSTTPSMSGQSTVLSVKGPSPLKRKNFNMASLHFLSATLQAKEDAHDTGARDERVISLNNTPTSAVLSPAIPPRQVSDFTSNPNSATASPVISSSISRSLSPSMANSSGGS